MWKTVASIAAFCSLSAAYSPLVIKNLNTHQPIGNPAGQTNYYRIQFDVTSSNGGDDSSTTCQTSWGDNSWLESEPYSMAVPTGKWIACGASDFRFQLFPYFSIGNFSLAIQQNFTDATTKKEMFATAKTHMSNSTSSLSCEINPQEVMYQQHAHGDCNMASNGSVSLEVEAEACTSRDATAIFEVTGSFDNGPEDIVLVGSIPELGNWSPTQAVSMSVTNPQSAGVPTFGARIPIAEGTRFEYKYIMREADGSGATWECCENRVSTVAANSACSEISLGSDWFRGGGDAVQD
ncbi:starch-binding domain-like protein [Aureobasidium sp. EXF-10728]|nr:starch-binding domain-like protein [Aureobasidium sp. EXF-10728]